MYNRKDKFKGDKGYYRKITKTVNSCRAHLTNADSLLGWWCTRKKGHRGPHAAHGRSPNPIQYATWI